MGKNKIDEPHTAESNVISYDFTSFHCGSKIKYGRGLLIDIVFVIIIVIQCIFLLIPNSNFYNMIHLVVIKLLFIFFIAFSIWQYRTIVSEIQLDDFLISIKRFNEFEKFNWTDIAYIKFYKFTTGITYMWIKTINDGRGKKNFYQFWVYPSEKEKWSNLLLFIEKVSQIVKVK